MATTTIGCDDKQVLLGYLYDEVTPEERRAVEAHLAACDACRREVADLRHVRVALSGWAPPEPSLGFRVVRDDPPRAPAWWRVPAWGFAWAAAAVLVLAAAAALANLDVRVDRDGLTVRTGWRRPAPAEANLAASAAEWRAALQALEARLERQVAARAAEGTARAEGAVRSASRGGAVDEAAIVRRVAALVAASEQRQRRELALRMAELVRDLDEQRRADWVRIQQGFGHLEQLTGASVIQQRDMWNYLMRVSQRNER